MSCASVFMIANRNLRLFKIVFNKESDCFSQPKKCVLLHLITAGTG